MACPVIAQNERYISKTARNTKFGGVVGFVSFLPHSEPNRLVLSFRMPWMPLLDPWRLSGGVYGLLLLRIRDSKRELLEMDDIDRDDDIDDRFGAVLQRIGYRIKRCIRKRSR